MDNATRIDELRIERHWSYFKLADRAGLAESTVCNWFNDKHFKPSVKSIEKVCAAFEISLTQFYMVDDVSNLSVDELKVLQLFKKLSANKRETAIHMLEFLNN